jgi:putative sugar O-methyltransferase
MYRYKLFLNFNFKNIKNSPYWEEYKKKNNVKIIKNSIKLSGHSGFYHNKKINFFFFFKFLRFALSKFKGLINYFFNNSILLLSYGNAFNMIFSNNSLSDIDINKYRINFRKVKNKSNIKNFSDIKNDYKNFCNLEATDHVVKSYYWFILLKYYGALSRHQKIVEIGAGTGHLASLIFRKYNSKIIIIDLFETLVHLIPYIKSTHLESNILFPNEITKKNILSSNFDFLFLLPNQIHLLQKNDIDLVINTLSFQEMLNSEIKNYFKKIYEIIKKGGFFFSVNRVEKIPISSFNSKYYNILPNRFFDYPFISSSKILIFEICRLMRLVQLDNIYIRLEKIINKK